MSIEWKNQIFKERGLWEVYKSSRGVLPKPKINRIIFGLTIMFFFILFIWSTIEGYKLYTVKESIAFLLKIADQSLIIAIGILGFLIAGFAIFASITNVNLFITLAKIPYKDSKINSLQFVFFNFINVFTVYIGLLVFCLLIVIGLADQSPLIRLSQHLIARCPAFGVPAIFFLIGVLGVWLVSAIVKLKSFVWNIYQTVLVSIATEAELQERNQQQT